MVWSHSLVVVLSWTFPEVWIKLEYWLTPRSKFHLMLWDDLRQVLVLLCCWVTGCRTLTSVKLRIPDVDTRFRTIFVLLLLLSQLLKWGWERVGVRKWRWEMDEAVCADQPVEQTAGPTVVLWSHHFPWVHLPSNIYLGWSCSSIFVMI